MVPVVRRIFESVARPGSEVDGNIANLLTSLELYYQTLLAHNSVALPDNAQQRMEVSLVNVARYYATLQAWAATQDPVLNRWGETIKLHFSIHLALQSRYSNPKLAWTYMDEDFMGLVKRIGEACASGTEAQAIVSKLIGQYCVGMDVRAAHDDA